MKFELHYCSTAIDVAHASTECEIRDKTYVMINGKIRDLPAKTERRYRLDFKERKNQIFHNRMSVAIAFEVDGKQYAEGMWIVTDSKIKFILLRLIHGKTIIQSYWILTLIITIVGFILGTFLLNALLYWSPLLKSLLK